MPIRFRIAMDDAGDCWYVIEDNDEVNAAWELWNASGEYEDEPAGVTRVQGPGSIRFERPKEFDHAIGWRE